MFKFLNKIFSFFSDGKEYYKYKTEPGFMATYSDGLRFCPKNKQWEHCEVRPMSQSREWVQVDEETNLELNKVREQGLK